MKKVIFVINNLITGGVQNSLRNLLAEIHECYDITLLCFDERTIFDAGLPSDVKIINVNSPFRYFGCSQREMQRKPIMFVMRALWASLTRVFGRSYVIKMMLPFQKKIGVYDYAISFLHEGAQKNFYGGCNEFVLNKVEAKKKITWLHCDFESCGANTPYSEPIYRQFDQIVACSEGVKRAFIRCMPQFSSKCVVIRNCNKYKEIRSLAGSGVPYDSTIINIVTVARLDSEKGIERMIHAIKECADQGYKLHYHIVGSGTMEVLLKEMVKKLKISDYVTFYGNRKNPYIYMKNADLFVLSSYHEAAPMVFDEAACLGIPVLATETTSTDEMILLNHSGFVCENSEKGVVSSLLMLMEKPERLLEIKKSLLSRRFSNETNVEAFKHIIQ